MPEGAATGQTTGEQHPSTAVSPIAGVYAKVKEKYPEHIPLIRVGDYYETFGEDAQLLHDLLEVPITPKGVAGIPYNYVEQYLPILIRTGRKIAFVDSGRVVETVQQQKGDEGRGVGKVTKALRDELVELMRSSGLDVVANRREGQRTLDKFRELARLMGGSGKMKTTSETAKLNSPEGEKAYVTVVSDAESGAKVRKNLDNSEKGNKKTAPQTASIADNQQHRRTVVSSADGATIQKKLDSLAEKIEKISQKPLHTFIGDLATALVAERHGSKSEYATFVTPDGKEFTLRLANHNVMSIGEIVGTRLAASAGNCGVAC